MVEKKIMRERQSTRHDVGREKFVSEDHIVANSIYDSNDFEVGMRHKLEFINIQTDDGKINSYRGSECIGMPRLEARVAITEALKSKGLYKGEEKNEMRLSDCFRTNEVVEPMIKPQWL
ncbi:valine--tRNA ligase, mitochondrial 1-like isoform X2 [Rutidosis leptorrhynchoides]|uniref:valine--tRNA ligase, mitochondrial 1-like isoform X2 n=1 Tax=Rutidosis leptorrhynchoides TaxID=125765 RepID=UPI003A99C2B7